MRIEIGKKSLVGRSSRNTQNYGEGSTRVADEISNSDSCINCGKNKKGNGTIYFGVGTFVCWDVPLQLTCDVICPKRVDRDPVGNAMWWLSCGETEGFDFFRPKQNLSA